MKIWKRFAAALLAAGMVLVMLAACSDGGGTPLSWETSQTKKYFESKGITGKEYTFKGTAEGVGEMGNVVYCVKGEQYYLKESYNDRTVEIIKDAQGDYYGKSAYDIDTWYKWAKGSAEAKNIDDNFAKYLFELPTKENVGSIRADEPYTFNGKSYYVETIKTHENRKFLTRSFLYEGNELKYILINFGGEAMLTNIEVGPTVDEQLFKAPEHYVSGGGNSGGPMVNILGKVVGIVESKLADDTIDNMGFALSADTIRDFIKWAQKPANNVLGTDLSEIFQNL